MPEGHTIHSLAATYNELFRGRVTHSSSPQGRFAEESARLDGRIMTTAHAYGKHLFVEFEGDLVVHIHLGLLGRVSFTEGSVPEPVGALRWRLLAAGTTATAADAAYDAPPARSVTLGSGAKPGPARAATGLTSCADLRGATLCELVTPDRVEDVVAALGPDPLRPDSDGERAWARISRSRTPVAVLLMDQKVAPGVGNIYRAELLYRHRIDPMMEGRRLRHTEWQAMWADLVELMRDGVVQGRIDTVRPEHLPEAQGRQPRVDRHGGEVYVYRRHGQPCLVCGTKVSTTELAGRNLFWCRRCQTIGRRRG